MTSDWLGGGLIFALAAVLWLIYLIPTWFRRNEFLSTERNVVRLQQTLRILAETSEVPDEIHAEANARSVAEQQRLLKKANAQNLLAERAGMQTLIEQGLAAQRAADHEHVLRERALREGAPQQARTLEEPEGTASRESADGSSADGRSAYGGGTDGVSPDPADSGDYETIVLAPTPTFREASLKLRRARAATSGVLLLALVVTVLGTVQTAINGAWIVLVIGAVAATLCVTRLSRLAKDARALGDRGRMTGEAGSSRVGPADSASAGSRTAGSRNVAASRASRRASGIRPGYRAADHARLTDVSELFDESSEGVEGSSAEDESANAGFAQTAAAAGDASSAGWTPVPLPKPLYVGHRRIEAGAPVSAYVEQTAERAEEALRAAARQSEQALRAAQSLTTDTHSAAGGSSLAAAAQATPAPTFPAVPSRFASMGVVDQSGTGAIDVDQVLARRRAG